MYAVDISKDASKTLRRMPRNLSDLIVTKIENLAADPFAPNNNVRALAGRRLARDLRS